MNSWKQFKVSACQTYHTVNGHPAYAARFKTVLKFHEPGLAPVSDITGAYHIDLSGTPAYYDRYMQTFGFYEGKAAVHSSSGWFHINSDGTPLYGERYAWCGNFQENYVPVKDFNNCFFHLNSFGEKAYDSVYTYVGDFKDGFATVQDHVGFYTHIDTDGHLLHGMKFLDLDQFHKGFARAKDRNGWHHINFEGQPIYPFRFKMIEPFYNGVSRVELDDGTLQLIDTDGNVLRTLRDSNQNYFHQVSADLVSYWKYYTIDAACTINLFDHLPCTVMDLRTKISLPLYSTELLLRALQEIGYVKQVHSSLWDITPKGHLLTRYNPHSLLEAQKLWKGEHLTSWQYLIHSLKTEKPAFNHLFGLSWFDYLTRNSNERKLYHDTLEIYAQNDYRELKRQLCFTNHSSILDVGGSKGALIFDLLNSYSHLKGFLLDLPDVLELTQIPKNLTDRVTLVPIDFFHSWPLQNVDAIFFSRVLHDWSDENCIHLLQRARKALTDSPNGRIYIIENVHEAALLNLNMHVMTEGRERSIDEFKDLLIHANLSLECAKPLNDVSHILIARKYS